MARVLFLAHRVPWPADKGDRLRSHAILRHLAARHEVWLGAFGDDGDAAAASRAQEAVGEWCEDACVVPLPGRLRGLRAAWTGRPISCEIFSSPRLDAWIGATAARVPFDAVLGYSGQMAPPLLRLRAPRRVIDLVDVDSAKWRARYEASRNPVFALEARRVRALEDRCLAELDGVTVVTRREAGRLGGATDRLRVVPMGVDLREFACRTADPGGSRIGFVGAMDYGPNAEGALWFAREVLPRVRARRPDAVFVVVGRNPPAALASMPGVETTGWVDDIRPVLGACAAGVVPILTSHGVQTKAIVSMALGLPQVVTAAALAGLDTEPGREVLAAGDAQEFAAAVLAVLDNPAERERLSRAGRVFAESRCDWARLLAPLEELLLPGRTAH